VIAQISLLYAGLAISSLAANGTMTCRFLSKEIMDVLPEINPDNDNDPRLPGHVL
jgi:hypothetical protein